MRIGIIGTLNLELLLGPIDRIPAWGKQALVQGFEMRLAGSALFLVRSIKESIPQSR